MESSMKLISWNVNGIRAGLKKGFEEKFVEFNADIFCIQETKMQEGQIELEFEGYESYWDSAVKKGYSGTPLYSLPSLRIHTNSHHHLRL